MNVPGFTAEVTLAPALGHYRATGTVAATTDSVSPAFVPMFGRWGCFARCLAENAGDPFAEENCRCICYGHPGRTCFLQ
jgi:hypothetical protein